MRGMERRELLATTPVLKFWNDGGPTASVSKGELHELTSQSGVVTELGSKSEQGLLVDVHWDGLSRGSGHKNSTRKN
jgi:hypothetical protein